MTCDERTADDEHSESSMCSACPYCIATVMEGEPDGYNIVQVTANYRTIKVKTSCSWDVLDDFVLVYCEGHYFE
jgi:hypothetical protein